MRVRRGMEKRSGSAARTSITGVKMNLVISHLSTCIHLYIVVIINVLFVVIVIVIVLVVNVVVLDVVIATVVVIAVVVVVIVVVVVVVAVLDVNVAPVIVVVVLILAVVVAVFFAQNDHILSKIEKQKRRIATFSGFLLKNHEETKNHLSFLSEKH